MKQILTILSLFIVFQSSVNGQGLQPGECGVMFTYDATGALIERRILCNNSGSTIFRTGPDYRNKMDSLSSDIEKMVAREEIIKVNAIMPNPTTGRFSVTLSQPLQNTKVILIDVNGRVIENKRLSGTTLNFDISSHAAGIYFMRMELKEKFYQFKIIKE